MLGPLYTELRTRGSGSLMEVRRVVHFIIVPKGGNMIRSLSRVALLRASATAISLVGCQKDSLTGPTETSLAQGGAVRLLALPKGSLHKVETDSALVTVQSGGNLQIHYKEVALRGTKKTLKLDLQVSFAPGAVSDDFVATVSTDAYYAMSSLDMTFGPHGAQFLKPARVSMHVTGMDLGDIPADAQLHLYYLDNGEWVVMPGTVTINPQTGEVKCQDGELPHFSQYAFGY